MEDLLDRFYQNLEFCVQKKKKIPRYIVNVLQVKRSFYVLVRKPRGKILNNDWEMLFENVITISKKLYI